MVIGPLKRVSVSERVNARLNSTHTLKCRSDWTPGQQCRSLRPATHFGKRVRPSWHYLKRAAWCERKIASQSCTGRI